MAFLLMLIFSLIIPAVAQPPLLKLNSVERPIYCNAPSTVFLETKIRDGFQLATIEREMKEIMTHPRNFENRQLVKDMRRRIHFADRIERERMTEKLPTILEDMIRGSGRAESFTDFPGKGMTSSLKGSSQGHLLFEAENITPESLEFLPPEIQSKLGKRVGLEYHYPIERFVPFLTYDGEHLPLEKALGKIQNDLESGCLRGAIENQMERRKRAAVMGDPDESSQGGASSR